jgi:hypothetical protein
MGPKLAGYAIVAFLLFYVVSNPSGGEHRHAPRPRPRVHRGRARQLRVRPVGRWPLMPTLRPADNRLHINATVHAAALTGDGITALCGTRARTTYGAVGVLTAIDCPACRALIDDAHDAALGPDVLAPVRLISFAMANVLRFYTAATIACYPINLAGLTRAAVTAGLLAGNDGTHRLTATGRAALAAFDASPPALGYTLRHTTPRTTDPLGA